MKPPQVVFLVILLVFLASLCPSLAKESDVLVEESVEVPLLLVLRFLDYKTGLPVSNLAISATVFTDLGSKSINFAVTNETGMVQVFLGNVQPKATFRQKSLQLLRLSDNYTLIKVQNVFMEDVGLSTRNYNAEYVANSTRHSGLNVDLPYKALANISIIECNVLILKGRLVRVLDSNPVTGAKENLIVTPAIKTNIKSEVSGYESYYFFPLGYQVTMHHRVRAPIDYETKRLRYPEDPVTALRVRVDENTTLVNWMSHAMAQYVDRLTFQTDKEMEWLRSSGYGLEREDEEYQGLKGLLARVLNLYDMGEYLAALGGARISVQRLVSLRKWVSDIKVLAIMTTVGIGLFAYGLASFLSSFAFEEPSANKARLTSKVLVFALIMLMFSLSHPSVKMTFASMIGSREIDLPLSLLGSFVIGVATYFVIQLLTIRKKTMTDLALQLGVRSLKRRKSRSILTLVTITVMVSSAIVFVNISLNRSTRIKESWKGTDIPGVLVKPDLLRAPLTEYDVNWTRAQVWCRDLEYREGVRTLESSNGGALSRGGYVELEETMFAVDIVGIEPSYIESHYNLPENIRGFWDQFLVGEPVIIVPATLDVLPNEHLILVFMETINDLTIRRPLGEFRVVGTFDPDTAFVNMTKIDNTSLFERPQSLVLAPIKSVVDRGIVITEMTVHVRDGFDPLEVAEELAYTLASTAIANNRGLAQRVEWSIEFSVVGLLPYVPPLVIAGLMMYATMVSVYEERKRDFTTLATLGLDPKNTFQVFLVEALLLGLMGTFLGFFGSYLLGALLYYVSSFLGVEGLPTLLSFTHWSMPAILVALLTGVLMVFLGGYIPAVRTQGLSLMGRVKRRQMIGELVSEGAVTTFSLPIRETIQNGELLYAYVRETIGKFKESLIDRHSVKGEIYRDGTFRVSFVAIGDSYSVFVPCEIKGTKDGEILVTAIEFPTIHSTYVRIREILRGLEEYMIGFSAWKEMQLKMKIVREAPRKRKTIEEILAEIKDVINQIRDCSKKLKILDGQKARLSEEVFNEFRQKYINLIEEKSRSLRSMTINLEPYHKELHEEIGKITVEVERITTSYNLDEIDEEEYVKTCGPLQGRLAELKSKVQEMEDIFEFLKKPLGVTYE